jgi:hypothetical protein
MKGSGQSQTFSRHFGCLKLSLPAVHRSIAPAGSFWTSCGRRIPPGVGGQSLRAFVGRGGSIAGRFRDPRPATPLPSRLFATTAHQLSRSLGTGEVHPRSSPAPTWAHAPERPDRSFLVDLPFSPSRAYSLPASLV